MSEAAGPKLPGWTRRSPELTPRIDLATSATSRVLDVDVFLDSGNDVAYRMIGGAYGVLGAEVLGHYVPEALDRERWGVYIREAGVAWLCSEMLSRADGPASCPTTYRFAWPGPSQLTIWFITRWRQR